MGGGGKGAKSSKPVAHPLIGEIQGRLTGTGQRLFDIGMPSLKLGSAQAGELIKTGGVGANVPLISQATRAQQRGTRQATSAVAQSMNRGGIPQSLQTGVLEQMGIRGEQRARNVGIKAALPLIYKAAGGAIKAPATGMGAMGMALQTMASGLTAPIPSGKPGGADALQGAVGLFGPEGHFPASGLFGGPRPSPMPGQVPLTPELRG